MKTLSRIYTILIFVLLYTPIAVMILFSFNASESMGEMTGFSFHWYERLMQDEETLSAFSNTIILAVVSALIATVFGTLSAVGIFKLNKGWYRSSIMAATNIPMMNPEIVTGVSMMLLFVFAAKLMGAANGALNFGTLLIAHITFNLPYVILSVLPKLHQLDPHLEEAAQDLGCTRAQAFFHAVLPTILPGVLSGMLMAFTMSLDDFVISYFTSGSEFVTLPIRIYSMTKKRVTPDMYALSTIIFAVILLLLILTNLIQAEDAEKKPKKKKREG